MNPQIAYAMITQMSPLLQAMSLPVSTLAANEMAARASMNRPRLTPTSTAKATKRDAKPAYFPCRLSRMMTGGPEGVASPAGAVMTLSWPAAVRRAGRAGVWPAAKPPYPAGDELVEPDGLAADMSSDIAATPLEDLAMMAPRSVCSTSASTSMACSYSGLIRSRWRSRSIRSSTWPMSTWSSTAFRSTRSSSALTSSAEITISTARCVTAWASASALQARPSAETVAQTGPQDKYRCALVKPTQQMPDPSPVSSTIGGDYGSRPSKARHPVQPHVNNTKRCSRYQTYTGRALRPPGSA